MSRQRTCLLCGGTVTVLDSGFTVTATEGPSTLAEAVEDDIADVLGSLPPVCSICGVEWTFPGQHKTCIERALECLRHA